MQNKNRVLVTGGAGFIGSELVRQLAQQGHRVVVVDNLVNGKRENLQELLDADQIDLAVSDIRDDKRMAELMTDIEIVFHLACLGVRHSLHSPHENHEVNATATLKLLSLAREKGVKRFVYVSSSEIYGTATRVPMDEQYPPFPQTVYGASKLAGECYARAFYDSYQFPAVVIRPFNTYGPRCHHEGDSGEVIPKFILRCMAGQPLIVFGDGTQTRDFTYVSDTARGILTAAFAENVLGETINLGSQYEISINDLAREIITALETPDAKIIHDAPRPGDVLRLYADTAKAQRLLRFKPQVSFAQGIHALKNWYLNSGKTVEQLLEQEITHNWQPAAAKTNA